MVKRTQHIGTFLHNEMGISMVGISPMCGRSSIHRQKIFFLKSIASGPSPSPAADLVAAYSFDEGMGTTVADAAGHGNIGTLSALTWTKAGKFGHALAFDGVKDVVIVPHTAL
jgi:hypothetical protein